MFHHRHFDGFTVFPPNSPSIIFTFQTTWFIPNNNKIVCDNTPDNTGTPGNVVCLLMAGTPTNVLVRLIMFDVLFDFQVYTSKYLCLQFFTNNCKFLQLFKLLSSTLYSLMEW